MFDLDVKKLAEELGVVLGPPIQQATAQLVVALREMLPGVTITITFERKSSAHAEGEAQPMPASDTGTTALPQI